jgi:hypothetical protein
VKGHRFAGYSLIRFCRSIPARGSKIASGVAENLRMQSGHNYVSAEGVLGDSFFS